jgi:hypothetical protein
MFTHSLPLPALETLYCFGPTFSPFGIKSLKRFQNKRSPRKLARPSKIVQKEMLNTREKAA